MGMRQALVLVPLILIVMASGCLIKQPAQVTFQIDKTVVSPGGTIHLIVHVNNTGKVGLVGANLILGNHEFRVLQEPKFPYLLKVGKEAELVWILEAPSQPGTYNLKVSLELLDELNRTWTGFYKQFTVQVSANTTEPSEVEVDVNAPAIINGGNETKITVEIVNRLDLGVELRDLTFNLPEGVKIIHSPNLPPTLGPKSNLSLVYTIKTPYAYRYEYITAMLRYAIKGEEKNAISSTIVKIVWMPWTANESSLKAAYNLQYHWITDRYIVDGYWMKKYNSTSSFNRSRIAKIALPVVKGTESEIEAAEAIQKWMNKRFKFGDTTVTVDPERVLPQDRISYAEGQILMTAMLRSVNIPARIVTLFNGSDCTIHPITEFYTEDGWYVVDLAHNFTGSRDEYLATPYFPRIYQMVTQENYQLVAQSPTGKWGIHEHLDVTGDYLANLQERLLKVLMKRLNPSLRSKVLTVINNIEDNERLYALFLFDSAPKDDLNRVLEEYSTERIEKNVKTMYEFYRDMTWSENFTRYWRIFAGETG